MGKASRTKHQHRQAMQSRQEFQQEASRQAKERRRKEIERHNASCGQAALQEMPETGEVLAMQIDGQLHVGKAAISEVYTSWIRNEIARDDVANLDEIAALGQPMQVSIWDVEVEVFDMDEGGAMRLVDPLRAAFVMEKSKCFEWLVNHACESPEGHRVVSKLLTDFLPLVDGMDQDTKRYRSATLMMRTVFNLWLDISSPELEAKMRRVASLSLAVTEAWMQVKDQRESLRQRQDIESSLTETCEARAEEQCHEAIRVPEVQAAPRALRI